MPYLRYMALYITSLNSGSNGNCYYVGNGEDAVLVDAGISCREITRRMGRLNLSMQTVRAIFISHEHSDHISGLEQLAKKYQLPVYITKGTMQYGGLDIEPHLVKSFSAFESIKIGSITVTAFPKFHDAEDPHSFIVSYNKVNVGVFTDIGYACDHVTHYFAQCHACFLESNYDIEMLAKGNYPPYLKKRITGGNGHLSNLQALELFKQHRAPFLSHLVLSHLSKNNNKPEIVQQLFDTHAGSVKMIVAPRFGETPVYQITATGGGVDVTNRVIKLRSVQTAQQLQLF